MKKKINKRLNDGRRLKKNKEKLMKLLNLNKNNPRLRNASKLKKNKRKLLKCLKASKLT